MQSFGRRSAIFWETQCNLLGDAVQSFGRRSAIFWETQCNLLGDACITKTALNIAFTVFIKSARFIDNNMTHVMTRINTTTTERDKRRTNVVVVLS